MEVHSKNATWSAVVTSLRVLVGFLLALLAVRLLGASAYGAVATLLSISALYLAAINSSSTIFVSRFVALHMDDLSGRSELIVASGLLVTGAILLLIPITLVLAYWRTGISAHASHSVRFEIDATVLMTGALTTIQILVARQASLVEAAGRLDLAMKGQLFGSVALVVGLLAAFILRRALDDFHYLGALILSAVVDFCVLWSLRVKLYPAVSRSRRSTNAVSILKDLIHSAWLLQATSLLNVFLEPMNKILLNNWYGPSAVTAYDFAMKLIWGIQSLFIAAMRVFLHLGSATGEEIVGAYMRMVALIAVPVMLVHICGAVLLTLVAHYWAHIDSSTLLPFYGIATISNLCMIFITPIYLSLISRGDMRFVFRTHAILAATNILLSLILVPTIGLLGASLGLVVATAYNTSILWCRYQNTVSPTLRIIVVANMVGKKLMVLAALFLFMIWQAARVDLELTVLTMVAVALFFLGLAEPLTKRVFKIVFRGSSNDINDRLA